MPGLVAVAAIVSLAPALPPALEYDRAQVIAGEIWRPLTAQVVHWSARMTAADLGTILVLGAVLEMRSRRAAATAVLAALFLVAAGVHFLPPPLSRYRGGSGIASGIFVALALDLLPAPSVPGVRVAAALALGLFLVKIALEAVTGQALFAGPMAPGVEVASRAHLLGALGGLIGAASARWP